MEDKNNIKNNTPCNIKESSTLSHPDAGLNENHLKTAQTEFELETSSVPQFQISVSQL
jgi:hypothetical protein